jgi:tripartite-type tricarboxylate transporter receptor subunit TctC
MITKRILLGAIVACCASAAAGSATAQSYPNRPVRLIVPSPPGGSADAEARLVGDHLSRVFGQQVIIENRSGANANIGIEAVARSAPDGYTALVVSDRVASAAHLFKGSINPMKDLTPVIQVSRQPVVLAVHPSLEVVSLAEFLTLAKRRPGMSYATSGVGNQQHIVAEWFAQIAGIKLELVPYRGGGQAINDLIAGHVKIGSLGSTPLIPHYKAGTLRLLAQSTAARSPSLPDVPTYEEAGIKGLVLDQWIGVFVAAGTPPAITARLNAEINKALSDPPIRQNLLQQAQDPVGGTVEEFTNLVREDFEKYDRLVKELNIKIE